MEHAEEFPDTDILPSIQLEPILRKHKALDVTLEVIHPRQLQDVVEGDHRLRDALEAYQNLPSRRSGVSDSDRFSLSHAMAQFRSFMQSIASMYRRIWRASRAYRSLPDSAPIHTLLFYVEVKFRSNNATEATDGTDSISLRGYIQNVEDRNTGETELEVKVQCIDKKIGSGVGLWRHTYHGAELA
jgi:hypothetical protein